MKEIKLIGVVVAILHNFIVVSGAADSPSVLLHPSLHPFFSSSNLSISLWNCSAHCHADPNCVGVTVYQLFNGNNNNETATPEQPDDFFWCKLTLTNDPEDLKKGKVVYKVMFRDKLAKVQRLPNSDKKSRSKTKRQVTAPQSNNTETNVTIPIDGQLTLEQKVPNQVPLIPPQKVLLIKVPQEQSTILPGELDSNATVATIPQEPNDLESTTTVSSTLVKETIIHKDKGKVEVVDSHGKNITVITNSSLPTVTVSTPNKNVTITDGCNLPSDYLTKVDDTVELTTQRNDATLDLIDTRLNGVFTSTQTQIPAVLTTTESTTATVDEDNKLIIDMVPTSHVQQEPSSENRIVVNHIGLGPPLALIISQQNEPVQIHQISAQQQQQEKVTKVKNLLSQTIASLSDLLKTLSVEETPSITLSTIIKEPNPSEQLEGNIDKSEPTDIPFINEEQVSTVFPILRPSNTVVFEATNSSSAPIKEQSAEQSTDTECIFSDREKFKRNILATTYTILHEQPTMITFVNGSTCLGTFRKSGKRGVESIEKVFPDFPSQNVQIVAGAFLQNSVYLFDSAEHQTVLNFSYNSQLGVYTAPEVGDKTLSKEAFLMEKCGMREEDTQPIFVKAIAQVSSTDPSCIIFDRSGSIFMSPNADQDARDLARAILFIIKTEFLDYVESVFGWLDEPIVNIIYVFGSNGEVYQLFRDSSTHFKWQKGAYRVVPYEDFPY